MCDPNKSSLNPAQKTGLMSGFQAKPGLFSLATVEVYTEGNRVCYLYQSGWTSKSSALIA